MGGVSKRPTLWGQRARAERNRWCVSIDPYASRTALQRPITVAKKKKKNLYLERLKWNGSERTPKHVKIQISKEKKINKNSRFEVGSAVE